MTIVNSLKQLINILPHEVTLQPRSTLLQDFEQGLVDEFKYQVEFALPVNLNKINVIILASFFGKF